MQHAGTLVDAVDEVGTPTVESGSTVAPRTTVVTVDADRHARRSNADALRRAGYSVIDLADREELLELLTSGVAVDCLVVAESAGRTLARRLVADARSVRQELPTILWENDRPIGTGQVCEAVGQLLGDAGTSRGSGRAPAPRSSPKVTTT